MAMLTIGERAHSVVSSVDLTQTQQIKAKQSMVSEQWQVLDQSASGIRIQSRQHFAQFKCHQLVAVRPEDSDHFMLGYISWLMYREDDFIEAAIQLLPGLPEVIAVRSASLNSDAEPFQQGFLLPAVPALKSEASLILPDKWFRQDRVIQYNDFKHDTAHVRLDRIKFTGLNFERVMFQPTESLTATKIN